METVLQIIAFIGSWLLFAGPIYQAALELQDEDIELDRIRSTGDVLRKEAHISGWLWVVPPYALYKRSKNKKIFMQKYLNSLTQVDIEQLISFRSKATAWMLVAIGGFCIASNETYILMHDIHWSIFVFILIVLAMLIASIAHLIYRIKQDHKLIKATKNNN
jgi:hypothetical protein